MITKNLILFILISSFFLIFLVSIWKILATLQGLNIQNFNLQIIMETNKITLYSSCLMLYIAKVDDIIDKKEIGIIEEILIDYFKINKENAKNIIELSLKDLQEATDIFQYANFINNELSFKTYTEL